MYKILCDDKPLYNLAYNEYTLGSPSLNLETNKAGSLSFTIYPNHPNFNIIQKMRSIISVEENGAVIFRGRVFSDEANFYKIKKVEVEGVLTYFNDSVIRPYDFTGSVLEYITFLINQHNDQVEEFQRFKLGNVTVEDENDYIVRANSNYPKTWEEIENKLIKLLGGYLCVRYEADGNYIDYLKEFTLTNTQYIEFSKNLLDLSDKYDASNIYTVIVPQGPEIDNEDGSKTKITIESLPDGDIDDDIVKSGDMIYSKSAVAKYGKIVAPVSESTWSDVTVAYNLQTKAVAKLTGIGQLLTNTFELNAVNLNYSDSQIASFRINRNVVIKSTPHGINETLPLTRLNIPIDNPQSTKITVGKTVLSLTDNVNSENLNIVDRVTTVEKDIAENRTTVKEHGKTLATLNTTIKNTCDEILISALAKYVTTGDFEVVRQALTEVQLLADGLNITVSELNKTVTDVDGDLQEINANVSKHFEFTTDGLIIKAGVNAMQITIDNDIIRFSKNGQPFGSWDGINFHTGNIIIDVNEKAQFGNFAFIPRSDESLSFLKVGG